MLSIMEPKPAPPVTITPDKPKVPVASPADESAPNLTVPQPEPQREVLAEAPPAIEPATVDEQLKESKVDSPDLLKPSKQPKPAKPQRSDNVKAAIIATVILVLGMSALAVFAYLKSR